MSNPKTVFRLVALCVALFVSASLLTETRLDARSRSKGATLVGTWYLSVPSGLRALLAFHQGGTLSEVTTIGFGGPPLTPRGPVNRSSDLGIWRRRGNKFESVLFRFAHDRDLGDVLQVTRIRSVYSLDRGFGRGTGQFFVMVWTCPTPTTCPDPNTDPPDGPEFAPPGNTFTMTRARMP